MKAFLKKGWSPIRKFLIKLGDVLGAITTRILLTLLYFTIVFLLFFFSRLFGVKMLDVGKFKKFRDRESYFKDGGEDHFVTSLENAKLPY